MLQQKSGWRGRKAISVNAAEAAVAENAQKT
jgi:hypothetical protein